MATKANTRNSSDKIARKPASSSNRLSSGKRPAAKRVQAKPTIFGQVLRENLHWLFLCAAAIVIGVLLFIGYQKVTASEIFGVKRVNVTGANRASSAEVEKAVRAITAKSGVWNADLRAVQTEIERVSWVKTATISRVLPDGLRIRLTEREPKAAVRLDSGVKVWVDDDARVLGAVAETEVAPFVITGWNESKDNEATRKNQERVRLSERLSDDWRKAEITNRVTIIDLSDLQDVEVFVDQSGMIIPVQLGNQDFSERLQAALRQLEILAVNNELATIEKIISYDRTPVVRIKTGASGTDVRSGGMATRQKSEIFRRAIR